MLIRTYIHAFVLILVSSLSLCGCVKMEKVTDNPGVNEWVHETMKEEYLWASMIGKYSPSGLNPKDYFETLRYRRTSGKLENDYYGDRFSSISKRSVDATRLSMAFGNDDIDEGFGFVTRRYVTHIDGGIIVFGQVICVVPGSPADKAGIRRGFNFNAVEVGDQVYHMPMPINDFEALISNRTIKLHIFHPESKVVEVTMDSYPDNPIIFADVYDTNQGKTAYLVYNHFTSGTDERFNQDLKDVFADFKSRGAKNLILDLRYNGGGELNTAMLLGSLIAKEDDLGEHFLSLERNDGLFYKYNFYSSEAIGAQNLDVEKLYIITLDNTASASELILHCLKPFFGDDLKHIGKKTYGKNVGSVKITNAGYDWELNPITLRVYDKNLVSGYEQGIEPDLFADEKYTIFGDEDMTPNSYSVVGDFGDLGEYPEIILQKVITYMNTGEWPVGSRSGDNFYEDDTDYETTCPDLPMKGLVEEERLVY